MLRQFNGVMKAAVLVFVLFLLAPLTGWSKEAVPVAENPEIEKRMLLLTENLRCLVC